MNPLTVVSPRLLCPGCGRRLLKVLQAPSQKTVALIPLLEPVLYIGLSIASLALGAAVVYQFVLHLGVAIVIAAPLVLFWILMFKAKRDAQLYKYQCPVCVRTFSYDEARRGTSA